MTTRARGLRVTGGTLRGRRLKTPSCGVRPSSDRLRESLFQRLGDLSGCTVLDLYAGSGALGFEALSRGAEQVVSVDHAESALAVVRRNATSLGVAARMRILRGDAVAVVRRLAREAQRFDLVLLDPPYAADQLERALVALREGGVLAPGASVVIERGQRHSLPAVEGFTLMDERRYGDSVVSWLEAAQ